MILFLFPINFVCIHQMGAPATRVLLFASTDASAIVDPLRFNHFSPKLAQNNGKNTA